MYEPSWKRIWKEIKDLGTNTNNKWREEAQRLSTSTILSYMNAPLMDRFADTKEVIGKFIVSRYHNGKFYFDTPVEIIDNLIYRLIGSSNKGDPVPVRLNLGLMEELTCTPVGRNSRGMIINQIIYGKPKLDAKIISMALTSTGRGSDLKLNMLEEVQNMSKKGNSTVGMNI